jgi:cellobiose dehydrogenase (acceptor)
MGAYLPGLTAMVLNQLHYSIPLSGLIDTAVDFQFGFVFPVGNKSTEFIGEFIVPVANKWAGISLGPGMPSNPLIMAWPYNGGVQHSVRFTTQYAYPLPYAGPIVTTLHTKTNATHWDWVFRCQNCTCALFYHTRIQAITHFGQ